MAGWLTCKIVWMESDSWAKRSMVSWQVWLVLQSAWTHAAASICANFRAVESRAPHCARVISPRSSSRPSLHCRHMTVSSAFRALRSDELHARCMISLISPQVAKGPILAADRAGRISGPKRRWALETEPPVSLVC